MSPTLPPVGKAWLYRFPPVLRHHPHPLRPTLAALLACDPRDVTILKRPNGKPYLDSATTDLQFNLTHTSQCTLLAMALDTELGLDAEPFTAATPDLARLVSRFTQAERQTIQQRAASEQPAATLGTWVRKEAVLKAMGTGFTVEPDELEVTVPPADPAVVRLPASCISANPWHLLDLDVPGHFACLAAAQPLQVVYR